MTTAYDMQFRLGAQMASTFNSTFGSAQKALSATQKEINELNKTQSNISAYQKQQNAMANCLKQQELYKAQIANLKKELQNLIKEQGQHGAGTSALANKILELEKKMSSVAGEEERHRQALKNLGNELKEAGVDTKKLGDEIEKVGKKMGDLKKKQDELSDGLEEGGEKGKNAFEQIGEAIAAAGIVTMLKESAEAALKCVDAYQLYGTSLAKVYTIADSSALSKNGISNQITALSNDAARLAPEIAEATYSAISAGIDTESSVMFVEKANKLAVGGFTEAETAVDVLTTALNAYRMSVSDVSKVSDYLITTQNLGKTTVDALASSVGKVIPVAAAYGVKMDNLSTAYAVMTANGIATAETTTYLKAMLNELGDSGSTVTKALVNETGASFATLTEKGYSLGDVLAALYDSVNGNAGAFNELWSSSEAGIGALSIVSSGAEKYNDVLGKMRNSTGATEAAFKTMADTSAFAEQQATVAANNLAIAYGEVLSPVIDGANIFFADSLAWITELVKANPELVSGLTASASVVGVATAGFVGYTGIVAKAIPLVKALGNAMKTAIPGIGPILAVTGAVAGVVGIVAASATAAKKAEDEYENLTAASRKQALEIKALEDEYNSLVEAGGANTYEAWKLEKQINALNEEYEASKQTIEEHRAQLSAAAEELSALSEEHENAIEAIDNEYESSMALIEKLDDLALSSQNVASRQALIKPIIDELNSRYEGLGLTIDYITGKMNMPIEKLREFALEEYNRETTEAERKAYAENFIYMKVHEAEYEAAQLDLREYEEEYKKAKKALDDYIEKNESNFNMTDDEIMLFAKKSAELGKKEKAAKEAYDSYKKFVYHESESDDDKDGIITAYEKAKNAVEEYEAQHSESISNVHDTTQATISVLEKLANSYVETYEKAYEAAYESITGQFDLWENAAEVVPKSISDINNALATQASYWSDYNQDMLLLRDRGKDIEGLAEVIASFADGSEASVNTIAGLVQGTDEELMLFVENFKRKTEEEAVIAGNLAEVTTLELLEIEDQMKATIENLDLKEEAELAGKNTIEAYVSALREGSDEAAEYLNHLAGILGDVSNYRAGSIVENRSPIEVYTPYATGTLSARSGWSLVGEEGPELVNFGGGEAVFDALSTERAISAMVNSFSLLSAAPVAAEYGGNKYDISVSPTFYVTETENTAEKLEEYSDIVANEVMRRLSETDSDAKRGAFI